jgi:hypothetical protein
MFHDIDVQVRVLPNQGQPGEAIVYVPEDDVEEPVAMLPPQEEEPEEEEVELVSEVVEETPVVPEPEPVVEYVRVEVPSKPRSQPRVRKPEPEPAPEIDWLWYELDPQVPPDEIIVEQESDEDAGNLEPWWGSSTVS